MNKTGLVLLSAALVGVTASAKDLYSSEDHPRTPVQVGLAAPIQYPGERWNVSAFRLNLLFGASHDMTGLDLGLVGFCRQNMTGLSVHAFNWVDSDLAGVQIGALGNVTGGNAAGLQIGGFLNREAGLFAGFQTALVNHDGSFWGLQLAGLNWNKSVGYGLQLGVGNVNVGDFRGWSVGALNISDSMTGLQLGVVNVASASACGVQIGVFNAASSLDGVQIGVLNVIADAAIPVLPVVNGNF